MKSLYNVLMICSLTALAVTTNVASARVSSLGAVKKVEIDDVSYQSMTIECSTNKSGPMLLKAQGQRQWCDSKIKTACYRDKIEAAKYVCSLGYARDIKNLDIVATETADATIPEVSKIPVKPKTAKSESRTERARQQKAAPESGEEAQLLDEQLSIQEELIELRTKHLALQREELKLRDELTSLQLQAVR